jgi:nucleoside-diphosphate-sugar epimerase
MKKLLITGASGFLGSHMVIEGLKKDIPLLQQPEQQQKKKMPYQLYPNM